MAPNLEPGTKACKHCGVGWKLKGLNAHERSCGAEKARKAKDRDFSRQLKAQQLAQVDAHSKGAAPSLSQPSQTVAGPSAVRVQYGDDIPDYLFYGQPEDSDVPENFGPSGDEHVPGNPPPPEDIKRVFHPHSKRQVTFQSFNEYVASNMVEQPVPTDPRPWRPFRSRLDFEVAEFCAENMLNTDSTGTLISLIRRCICDPDDFTLTGPRDLDELWELASHKCTPFEKGTVTIKYKKEDKTFDTYTRPLWDWARSLIQDPRLASCFIWDAEKAYKFHNDSYLRFYHEPWTADAFWAAQSRLPDDPAAKPICLFVYADKSKLSSFGTQKGYAVVAEVANLPIVIRHSIRFGGGQVVGHQPIVKDDPQENNKPAFSNFKNIVWHTAFYKLLESLVQPAKVGDWTKCGDGILRWLWPTILILAADYEEACVMALIRGLQGNYPCPICFVPWNEQSDLSTEHPLRTGKESEEILRKARAKRTLGEREDLLKDNGLRDVENVFWKIKGSDPHAAISYDPLHADDGGFWGDHLFAQIKARVTELGRAAIVKIDAQMANFPRWRGLNHFETVMNTSFNDGSKHEDIAKMMLFVAHNVLVDDGGLLLLQALRSYLEYRTSLSLEVHMSETIADGNHEVLTLDSVMKDYISACKGTEYEDKNWNFPKFHARNHALDDIQSKGASRNFGTRTSESKHSAIRKTYQRMTNFKDVTPQLVKHDHRRTVATFIRDQIDALDEDPEDAAENPKDLEAAVLSNVDIGSKLSPVSFSTVEQAMSEDTAFERFRIKFGDFISDFLPAFGYNLPNRQRMRFDGSDMIVPFQFLKVHYESMGTWTSAADYLRCNPKFHGHPRYDCVLIETAQQPIFAQMIYLFSCVVEDKSHPFALVQPLDAPTGRVGRKDKLLRFHRVRAKPRKNSEFISVHSIIRGVVLVPDFDRSGEFIVFDVLDTDMSRRLKSLYPPAL